MLFMLIRQAEEKERKNSLYRWNDQSRDQMQILFVHMKNNRLNH